MRPIFPSKRRLGTIRVGSQNVIVEIMPSLLAVRVTRHGRVVAAREECLDRSDWGANWVAASESLAATLERIVSELGVRGRNVTIVYDVPGTACVVTVAAPGMSPSRAMESACLAAESALADGDHEVSSAACPLHRAPRSTDAKAHYLACAEHEKHLANLANLVESAGLKAGAMTPREACSIAEAVMHTTSADQRPHVVASIGRHAMAVAIARDGQLLAARSINIGLVALVDAMLRSTGRDGQSTPPPPRTRAEAWERLWAKGIPNPESSTGASRDHSAAAMLPLLQPVLQRLAVEIKQSLRFEVEAGVREEAVLSIVGPGQFCPGLLEALGRFVGVETRASATASSTREHGASFAVASRGMPVPALLPRPHADRRVLGRVRAGLAIGGAVAIALAAQSRVSSTTKAGEARSQLSTLEAPLADAKRAADDERRTLQAQSQIAQARGWLNKQLGDGASFSATLRLLSGLGTPEVRVRTADITSGTTGVPQLIIFAMTPDTNDGAAADAIRRYMSSIEHSPIVAGAKLGATQRVETEGCAMQSFTLTVDLVAIPGSARVARVEGQP